MMSRHHEATDSVDGPVSRTALRHRCEKVADKVNVSSEHVKVMFVISACAQK